jgi:hypothetical protein
MRWTREANIGVDSVRGGTPFVTVITATALALVLMAAVATSARAKLESRKTYALSVGVCTTVYPAGGPSIEVDPPRMWATYDTSRRVGQRVAWRPVLYVFRGGHWLRSADDTRNWEYGYVRNQAPRDADPGRQWTYVLGTLIFTGAEQGSSALPFDRNTGFSIGYVGQYRIGISMVWFANRYSKKRAFAKWLPLRPDLGDGYFFNCNVTN